MGLARVSIRGVARSTTYNEINPHEGEHMAKHDINRYLKSRWDARFLINTIMGALAQREGPYADVVLAVSTAAIRS